MIEIINQTVGEICVFVRKKLSLRLRKNVPSNLIELSVNRQMERTAVKRNEDKKSSVNIVSRVLIIH